MKAKAQDKIFNEGKESDDKIKLYIRKHLLKGALTTKKWCKFQNLKAKLFKIRHMFSDLRQELFLSDK